MSKVFFVKLLNSISPIDDEHCDQNDDYIFSNQPLFADCHIQAKKISNISKPVFSFVF